MKLFISWYMKKNHFNSIFNSPRDVTDRHGGQLGEQVQEDVAVRVHDVVPAAFVIVREKGHGVCILKIQYIWN